MPATRMDPTWISFRKLERKDFQQLHVWLNQEHLRGGWFPFGTYPSEGYSLEEVARDFAPDVDGTSCIEPFIVEFHGVPIGYVQRWRIADFLDYAGSFIDDDTPAFQVDSIDIFIGELEYTGRGLSPDIIRAFLERCVFIDPAVTSVIINPASTNLRAIRAYEKAGFRHIGTARFPGAPDSSYALMRLDREDISET